MSRKIIGVTVGTNINPHKLSEYIDKENLTIADISESTEDGGYNIITFSDGSVIQIKNGNAGESGVHVGTEEPEDESLIWIDLDDEDPTGFATEKYVDDAISDALSNIVQAVINELPIYNGEVIQ